jgi:hypothetical protein
METISERLSVRDKVIAFVRSAKPSLKCFLDGKFNSIKIGRKLGSGENVQGDVYKGCTTDTEGECAIDVALKVILPVSSDVELVAMDILVNVLKERHVPNIPLMYMWGKCPDCRFADGAMWISDTSPPQPGEFSKPDASYRKYNKDDEIPCTTFLSEYAVLGDIDNWLKTRPSDDEIYNAVFQLTAAMATLYYNYGMTHNDIHLGNALVHKTTPGGYWEYFICGKRYMCPNIGILAVLWDFGFATMPGVIGVQQDYVNKDGYFQSVTRLDMFDLRRLCKSLRARVDTKFLRQVCEYINGPDSDISGVLDNFYKKYIPENTAKLRCPRGTTANTPVTPEGDESTRTENNVIESYFTSQFADIAWFAEMDDETLARLCPFLDADMWRAVVVNRGLSVKELHQYAGYVDWKVVSLTLRDREVAVEFGEMIDWGLASTWRDIGEDLIEQHISEVDWLKITRHAAMSAEFMIKHKDRVVWEVVSDRLLDKWCTVQILAVADRLPWNDLEFPNRTIRSCKRLQEFMGWRTISAFRTMSIEFIRAFRDKIVPLSLSTNTHIDFDAVATEFPGLIVWEEVTPESVETLRLFKDRLNWTLISFSLEEKYVDEFADYIDWPVLQKSVLISSKTLDKYIDRVDFSVVSKTQVLEPWFVDKYKNDLDWGVLDITLFDVAAIAQHSDSINWGLQENIETVIALEPELLAWLPGVDWAVVSRVATDRVVEKYGNRLDWEEVSAHATLSASTVWKHKEKINFSKYSRYDKFSFTDYVILTGWLDFDSVSRHARLSRPLVRMMSDVFFKKGVIKNLQYTEFDWEFFRKYRDTVNWSATRYLKLPEQFRREFSEFLKL